MSFNFSAFSLSSVTKVVRVFMFCCVSTLRENIVILLLRLFLAMTVMDFFFLIRGVLLWKDRSAPNPAIRGGTMPANNEGSFLSTCGTDQTPDIAFDFSTPDFAAVGTERQSLLTGCDFLITIHVSAAFLFCGVRRERGSD